MESVCHHVLLTPSCKTICVSNALKDVKAALNLSISVLPVPQVSSSQEQNA